jgi:hypothetical protein
LGGRARSARFSLRSLGDLGGEQWLRIHSPQRPRACRGGAEDFKLGHHCVGVFSSILGLNLVIYPLDLPRVIIVKCQRYFVAALFLALVAITRTAAAQSTDQSLPTPVLSNEINGRIAALDLGDPRLTRHFYAFEGVPGDLLVTLSSRNLNGDIDVFTAVTFRPIMKITMYAGSSALSPEVTKGFYLRTRQVLILRVEARTPNDDTGTYKIRFSGAYEPFSGGIPVAEASTEQSAEVGRTSGGNKTRLSSVGARIEEPPSDTSAKPAEKSAEETAINSPSSAKGTKPKSPRSGPTRTARGRPSRTTRSKPASTGTEAKTGPAKTEAAQTGTSGDKKEPAAGEEKPAATEKSSTPDKPAAQEAVVPKPGARLIIEETDGTKIDRPMSTIRRVVVEGGTIVIVLKTGRIERVPMSVLAKMSIEP